MYAMIRMYDTNVHDMNVILYECQMYDTNVFEKNYKNNVCDDTNVRWTYWIQCIWCYECMRYSTDVCDMNAYNDTNV